MTGGPGTGKTTTVRAILDIAQAQGLHVVLAAPTGRAAKRLGELCNAEAKTLHRLLETLYSEASATCEFARNEENPIDADLIIVDELSMVDLSLFAALLHALPEQCSLVLVGDPDQLPAVGPGNVLKDLIAIDIRIALFACKPFSGRHRKVILFLLRMMSMKEICQS